MLSHPATHTIVDFHSIDKQLVLENEVLALIICHQGQAIEDGLGGHFFEFFISPVHKYFLGSVQILELLSVPAFEVFNEGFKLVDSDYLVLLELLLQQDQELPREIILAEKLSAYALAWTSKYDFFEGTLKQLV